MKSGPTNGKPPRDARLTAINFVSDAVNRALDLREIAENALHGVLAAMKLDAGAVYIWQETANELVLFAARGLAESFARQASTIRRGLDLTIDAVLAGAPRLVTDFELAADPPQRAAAVEAGFKAALLTPIRAQGYVVGMLALGAYKPRRFSPEDTELIETISNQIGNGLVHAQLQADLRASEEQHRALVENSDDVIYIADLDGRPLFGNSAFTATFGYTVEELAALEPFARVHDDDVHAVARAVSELIHGGVVRNLEYRFCRKDDTWIDLQCNGRRFAGDGQQARQLQFIVREVTDIKRHQQQLLRRNRQLAALTLLSDVANSSLNIEEIARNTLEVALQTTGMEAGCVHLADTAARRLTLYQQIGLPAPILTGLQELAFGQGVAGEVAASGEARVVPDLSAVTATTTAVNLGEFKGLAVAPVKAKGQLLGTLALISRQALLHAAEVGEMVNAIGNQLGIAMANARLYETQLRENEKLGSLVDIGGETARRLDLATLLQRILDRAARLLKADAAYMIRFDEQTEQSEVVAATAPHHDAIGPRGAATHGLSGLVRAARKGRIFAPAEVARHGFSPILRRADVRSALVAPLIARETVIGTLTLVRHAAAKTEFTAADLELIEVFASRAAVAIDNAQLLDDLQAKNRLLQLLMEEAHHRIKNNLQMVSGLLQLQAEGSGESAAAESFRNANARIHAIAHVHNLLSQEMPDKVDARALLNTIVSSLVAANDPRANAPRVEMAVEAIWLSSEQAVAVALVVNELVSNSLLHGRAPADAALCVAVSCRREGARVRLRIADNGGGLPANLAQRRSGGQGMNIISQLAQVNLRGTLQLDSRDGGVSAEVGFELLHPGAPPPRAAAPARAAAGVAKA